MTDVFSREKRSEIMSRIRSKNTVPEKTVFSYLRKKGIYFRRHYPEIPGKPDIALPGKKKAVFIDGGFWHGFRFSTVRRRLSPYWKEKIQKNILRDRKNRAKLKRLGWSCMRVWDHDLEKRKDESLLKIMNFLEG
ncbi:MAG: very short patch repair endonuclease [Patescibacteria group bacterium]|nr:very short patch repair endonuclease [Patescibacteria group bacterium]